MSCIHTVACIELQYVHDGLSKFLACFKHPAINYTVSVSLRIVWLLCFPYNYHKWYFCYIQELVLLVMISSPLFCCCGLVLQNAQSVSHVTEILAASSLSDEEIQRLIELLLEKSNTNNEWEAVSLLCYATYLRRYVGLLHMYTACLHFTTLLLSCLTTLLLFLSPLLSPSTFLLSLPSLPYSYSAYYVSVSPHPLSLSPPSPPPLSSYPHPPHAYADQPEGR